MADLRVVARVLSWVALLVAFGGCAASVRAARNAPSPQTAAALVLAAAVVLAIAAFALGAGRRGSVGGGAPAAFAVLVALASVVPLISAGQGQAVVGRPLRGRWRPWRRRTAAEEAVDELRSVPAFARLSLALASVGAPLDLVSRCHAAALDEVRHARSAARLRGVDTETVHLPELRGRQSLPRSRVAVLARLAVESYLDGCLGEGRAVTAATTELREGADAERRAHLRMVVEDEARHADLAWDVLEFASAAGGEGVRAALRLAVRRTSSARDDVAVAARARVAALLAAPSPSL